MNATTSAGLKRALNAAWDHLPQVLLSSILAIAVFLGGLWLGHRDLVSVVDGIAAKQEPRELCSRVGECPLCERLQAISADTKASVDESKHHINSHNAESAEWKRRIIDLETKVYEMATRATARPDPFTGTDGAMLRKRIDALEARP